MSQVVSPVLTTGEAEQILESIKDDEALMQRLHEKSLWAHLTYTSTIELYGDPRKWKKPIHHAN